VLTFLIIVVVLAAAYGAWRLRVPLMAKVLGQSPDRVDRTLGPGRKRR
jgi:hypothetical protein